MSGSIWTTIYLFCRRTAPASIFRFASGSGSLCLFATLRRSHGRGLRGKAHAMNSAKCAPKRWPANSLDGKEVQVLGNDLKIGERLRLRNNDFIPADGESRRRHWPPSMEIRHHRESAPVVRESGGRPQRRHRWLEVRRTRLSISEPSERQSDYVSRHLARVR